MSARMHPHSPLPAPALHASNPSTQSKSHVLAGVQDAYWSDDEAEDAECPLCLEEMDISDLNFKPCPCGYQICRFCWHHIKENLNRRCPACRREYTDEAVQFKPINKEDHKRLTQQKKQRERERKELDALGRRHLANVRVVQRNVVYVIGMGPRFAKEELIPTLRSSEYFGQYGKISKIVIVKRTSPGGRAPVVGLYITYHRREDAARAIAAVDGAPSPGGGNEIMRASYGTTKYCMAFLRGVSCTEHGCMNLHEWGDEKDCFTKEDLTTLKHTMKDTENRPRTTIVTRKGDEADGLPRAAAWGKQGTTTTALHNNTNAATTAQASTRQTRRGGTGTRQQRSSAAITSAVETRATGRDRKGATAVKASSQASSSRPATPASTGQPARPVTPSTTKAAKQKEAAPAPPLPPRSPTSSTLESESGSAAQDVPPVESPVQAPSTEVPAAPPGLPAVPPGLTAPPGLPPPSRTASTMSSPLSVTVQPSQSSYQMSTQAQALMEDLRARREMPVPAIMEKSPFPDFDRMLQTLSGDDGGFGGFSFNLDPALAGEGADEALVLPELDVTPNTPFTGTFLDAFPGLRQNAASGPLMGPPGLAHPARPAYEPVTLRQPALDRQPSGGSGYTGSFNPFGSDANDDVPSRRYSPLDEERQVSRFTFARGRQGSTSSSLHASSPLNHADNFAHAPYYNSSELVSPARRGTPPQWLPNRHQAQEFIHGPHSAMNSPLAQQAQQAQAHPQYAPPQQQHPGRFQPFDPGVSEAQLRDFINSSREKSFQFRHEQSDPPYKPMSNQPFNDPAIMSARLASPVISQPAHDNGFTNSSSVESFSSHRFGYGPPPGLSFQDGSLGNVGSAMNHNSYGMPNGSLGSVEVSQASGSAHVSTSPSASVEPSVVPSPALSSSDFPALSATATEPALRREQPSTEPAPEAGADTLDDAARAKAERKAAKKAAATERAAERKRVAAEKAAARAVEKERIAQEKAAERERQATLKAEKDKAAEEKAEREKAERLGREKAERDKAEKEKAERERAAQERQEKEKAERERLAQAKKAAAAANAKTQGSAQPGRQADDESPGAPAQADQGSDKAAGRKQAPKQPAPIIVPEPEVQVPILSKMPKKHKPNAKPIKIPKDDFNSDPTSALPSSTNSEAPGLPDVRGAQTSSNVSRAQSVDRTPPLQRATVQELLQDLDSEFQHLNIHKHPFFDLSKINPAAKMPLEYGPLVHALSALSVGGGSFANNMPSGAIDNAVSSFQQLLETLTQTISDLLRLLPRKTWDDNSSFDGVLREMLKGDDFLDDGGEDGHGHVREDEVAALTLALERRARWMEVQLSKLEELHRDINTAAVRAVLSFNDNGWDARGRLPKVGNTLLRFDTLGVANERGMLRMMSADELEKKLVVAKEAAAFAEAELRETMQRMQEVKPMRAGH